MASEGFLLKEKDFREHLKNHDWTQSGSVCGSQLQYGRHCSRMASILVTTNLSPLPKKVINGNIDDLNAALYEELLAKIDHWRMLIKNYYKGCSQKTVPMCLCFYCAELATLRP
jgi:hypothetical protein